MRLFHIKKEQLTIGKDIGINIIASFICSAVLNLIIYPLFARQFSSESYGMILTAIGVINILFSSLGNSLNNVRLIMNRKVGKRNKNNPYNLIIIVSAILGTVIGTIIIQYIYPLSFITTLLVSFTLFVGIVRAYFVVTFRLQINYIRQLISNSIVAVGYIIGILSIKTVNLWPVPFLLGETFSLIYVFFHSELFREGVLQKTDNNRITKSFLLLVACNLLTNILVYLDRFIINPILGATFVSIFTVASFWGKCFSPFIAPTATVILSYLSKENTEIGLKKYRNMFMVTLMPILFLCVVGIKIAPFLTELLYPTLSNAAEPYIMIASIGALIGSATALIMPMIMSVCSMKDLFILQSIQFVIYIMFAYVGSVIGQLMGFCVALLIVNIIKVTMNYFFGRYRIIRAGIL